jgi:hypothetical protein
VNHLRSLNGVNDTAAGSSGWSTGGERVRAKRLAQAAELAQWIEARQQAHPNERLLLVGDFNAFEFSDGLADVMGLVTGREAAQGTVLSYVDSPVSRPLTNLTTQVTAAERYSYNFEGNAQSLDHIVANAAVFASTLSVRTAHAAINADFSETRFGQSGVRTSDHDPVVVRLQEARFRQADLGVSLEAASQAATGQPLSARVLLRNAGPDEAARIRARLVIDRATDEASVQAPAGWRCEPFRVVTATTETNCQADGLATGASATFTVTLPAAALASPGMLGLRASVEADSLDANTGNNTAGISIALSVPADLAVDVIASGPGSSLAGAPALFVVRTSNRGPATAREVRVDMVFRGNARLLKRVVAVGWQCSQGAPSGPDGAVSISCRLPYASPPATLPDISLLALPNDPTVPARVSLDAGIRGLELDVVQSNNSDRAEATVGRRGR